MLIRHSSQTKLYNCILKNKFLKYGNNTWILLEPLTYVIIAVVVCPVVVCPVMVCPVVVCLKVKLNHMLKE